MQPNTRLKVWIWTGGSPIVKYGRFMQHRWFGKGEGVFEFEDPAGDTWYCQEFSLAEKVSKAEWIEQEQMMRATAEDIEAEGTDTAQPRDETLRGEEATPIA